LAEEKAKYDVTVLSRDEVTTFPKIAQPVVIVETTYVAAGLPPATVRIPKEEWDPEVEKRKIREDIEKRLKQKVEVFRV